MNEDQSAAWVFGAMGLVCCGVVLVGLAIQAVICYFLSQFLAAVPPEHRKQEPKMAWLLMIPLFNLVWNFFVYPKISESYQSYFSSVGRTDVGDCGKQIGFIYCILAACSIIPYLGMLTGLGALVCLILFLIKGFDLKGKVTTPPAAPPTTPVV